MRSTLMAVVLAALLVAIGGTAASAAPQDTLCWQAYGKRQAVVKKHGARAPGRNICRDGVKNGSVETDATTHEKAVYLRALKALLAPPPAYLVRTAIAPGQAPAGTLTAGIAAGGTLEAIAACESGGNPAAVSKNGTFRGKYQFDYGTWQGVGGVGDPAAAPEAEQDRRAALLYSRRGAQPWPTCGR